MKKIREKLGESYLQPTGIPMITDAYNLPAKKTAMWSDRSYRVTLRVIRNTRRRF